MMHSFLRLGALAAAVWLLGIATVQASDDGDAVPPAEQEPRSIMESGIEGDVSIGSGCPRPTGADPECQVRLSQLAISVLDQHGQVVSQIQPDLEGRLRVTLTPGTYTIRPERGPWINAREQIVTVTAGQFTPVRIAYESGIR
jgi:hypothetical protein